MAQPTPQLHTCHVCGMPFLWTDKARQPAYRMVMCGRGYLGYEVDFVTCSETCRENSDEPFKAFVKKVGGKMPKADGSVEVD